MTAAAGQRRRDALRYHGDDPVRVAAALQISYQAAIELIRRRHDAPARGATPSLDPAPAPAASPPLAAGASVYRGERREVCSMPPVVAGPMSAEPHAESMVGSAATAAQGVDRAAPCQNTTPGAAARSGGRGISWAFHDDTPRALRCRGKRDALSDEERRLIDAAVAAGKVTRIDAHAQPAGNAGPWRRDAKKPVEKWRAELWRRKGTKTRSKQHAG